jgi:uncharacterized protein (UPF0261 family)
MRELGRQIAERIAGAVAPTAVMVPTRGLSLIGVPGGPIADSEADAAVIDGLRDELPASIPLEVLDTDINSEEFGNAVASRFLGLLAESGAADQAKAKTGGNTPTTISAQTP